MAALAASGPRSRTSDSALAPVLGGALPSSPLSDECNRRQPAARDASRPVGSGVDPLVFVLVAGAAVLHVTWNVLLKTAGDPLRAAAVGMATAAAVICPIALVAWLATGRPAIPPRRSSCRSSPGCSRRSTSRFSPRPIAAATCRSSIRSPAGRRRCSPSRSASCSSTSGSGPLGYARRRGLLVGLLTLQRPWHYLRAAGRASGGAAGFALLTGVTIASYSAVDRVGVRGTTPWLYAGADLGELHGLPRGSMCGRLRAHGGPVPRGRRGGPTAAGPDGPTPFSSRRAGVGGLITLARTC